VSRFFRVAPFTVQVFINTLLFIAALAFFAIRAALALAAGKLPDNFDLGASIALAIVIAYAWLRSVKGYRLAQRELVIERVGPGKLHISLENILSAEAQPNLGSFLRTGYLSIQGLFGWAGKTIVRKPTDLKSQQAEVYGTNPASAVVLRLQSDRMVIVTPAEVDSFLQALREAGVTGPHVAAGPPPRTYTPGPARKKARR
jgi:hypothetical protein